MARKKQGSQVIQDLKALVKEDQDLLREIVNVAVREMLEAEMDEALGAGRYERGSARTGWRAGHHNRTLVTRVGKLELRVPQDREGRFSTEIFERYQRVARRRSCLLSQRCM